MNSDLAEQLSAMELLAEQPHAEQQPGINQPLDELPMPPKLRAKPNRRSIGREYESEAAFAQDLESWNAERAARALLMQEREKKMQQMREQRRAPRAPRADRQQPSGASNRKTAAVSSAEASSRKPAKPQSGAQPCQLSSKNS